MLSGLKKAKQDQKWKGNRVTGKLPINFCMVSMSPGAFADFETPFGEFNGLKRQGEAILKEEFPSLSHTILQMSRYDDNFVSEGLDVVIQEATSSNLKNEIGMKRINRRDAARAAVEALTNEDLLEKTVQVWTEEK